MLEIVPTRHDISTVPPQGGYIAKQCPVVAHLANDPTIDVVLIERPDDVQLRMDRGIEFEVQIFAELSKLHPEATIVDRDSSRADREARTKAAMDGGVMLIVGGRLPADAAGRRVGEPDLLVRDEAVDGRWTYHPIDVKHHLTLAAEDRAAGARTSPLSSPALASAANPAGSTIRPHEGDALQLAHYHRMLEACAHASPRPAGGIIGKELVVVWYDFHEPMWRSGGRIRTTLERYDFEFDFRLDIIAIAQKRGIDATIEPLVVPVKITDCGTCEWWEVCRPVLEDSDDVSLLPRIGWPQWRDLHLGGITTTEQLAQLDWQTADLIRQGVDVATYLEGAAVAEPATPVADVIGRRRAKQIRVLSEAGFTTAGDAARLDAHTVEVATARAGSSLRTLPAHIEMARARIGTETAYRKRDIDRVSVPRADVEIDIDMENTIDEQAYLWGALVTDRSGTIYHPFVRWDPMDSDGTARQEVFHRFWSWITTLIESTESAGGTVAVYCYSSQAEERHMRRGIAGDDTATAESVEAFIQSGRWVDMRKEFESQLITGESGGLKTVAALAGFAWRDAQPGGGNSMVWYQQAVAGDAAARERVLAYNEDDVRATKALRDWMDGSSFPSITEI
ncbi:MAG: TM0106 family RecB-like putative nuclease [Acidimicrobiia bacterium]|nr:TM0106 family RecB-like putative nuclease [Acidimicrobiia bacterium]